MKIDDKIFDEIVIKEALVLELINTPAFQRLKNINQYGGVNFVYPQHFQTTRFEHSIGAWHILNQLGASLEVQIAGLLHDIGHTAFSHMIDHAMESHTEDFHEKIIERLEGMDEIRKLLSKNGIDLKPVDQYPEIKTSLPNIGADRLDYGLRDYMNATLNYSDLGSRILKHIFLHQRRIVFDDKKLAKEYALKGVKGMWLVIYDPKVAVVYASVTEMLKEGLADGWLSEADLLKTDSELLGIFKQNRDRFPDKYIRIFEEPFEVIKDNVNYDFQHSKLKHRYFDPLVKTSDGIKNLTEIDADFKQKLEEMRVRFEKRESGEGFRVEFM